MAPPSGAGLSERQRVGGVQPHRKLLLKTPCFDMAQGQQPFPGGWAGCVCVWGSWVPIVGSGMTQEVNRAEDGEGWGGPSGTPTSGAAC